MREQGGTSNFKERFLNPLKETVLQVPTYARQLRDWISAHKEETVIAGLLLVIGAEMIASEQARTMLLTGLSAAIVLSGVFTVAFLSQWPVRKDSRPHS